MAGLRKVKQHARITFHFIVQSLISGGIELPLVELRILGSERHARYRVDIDIQVA